MTTRNPLVRAGAAAALLFATAAPAFAADYQIDPSHSTAGFAVKHMMISTVRGNFQKVAGNVTLDDADVTKSIVDVTIDAASIDTREPKRDAHLKSPDFFDVTKFPTITFKSTKIEKLGKDKLKVIGELTMHGQTHPVTLTVEGPTAAMKTPWGGTARGVSATGKLNRKEWGLNWNKALEAGGVLVGEEVTLQIDAELAPKAPQAAQK
jgi:polyisoprenoid-binding protein YceI